MTAFVDWLGEVGLAHCAPALSKGGVDFDVVQDLNETHLTGLGLNLGDSRRLLKAIATLRTATPPLDERRQLTVMFCDMVGSTQLSHRIDAEEFKRRIIRPYRDACRRVVEEKYRASVKQYTGDGVMAYFESHEDNAERSVRAALDIVEAVRGVSPAEKLSVRIAIATGPVVVGVTSGDGHADDGLAVGETPNRAERLHRLAGANEIVIDPVTRKLIGSSFELTDLGMHTLDGIGEPVQAWRVRAERRTAGRFDAAHGGMPLTALVGREEEVLLLRRRWIWASQGEGQIVLLCGEPGIGKSRLTQVLREQIKGVPHTTLHYQCSPFRVNSALYPIIEQIEFAAGFTRDDAPEEKLDKLEAVLTGSQEQRRESYPLFAALLSLPTERYPSLGLSPRMHKDKTLEVLVKEVKALSQDKPLLIIFEDAHWIDPTSQELLDLLMPQLRTLRILMVITHRPEYTPHGRDYPHVSTIVLKGLPQRLSGELARSVTGGNTLPPEVIDRIVAHADGVPLFIEELTRSLLESRSLRSENDRYTLVEPLPAVNIPETLSALLMERLGRRTKVRELAQIGACIGREFPYELLAAVSPYRGGEFDEELQRMTETGLVFRRGTPPHATYTFKHALVQDAAYDSLLRSKRQQVHAQIARALETAFRDRVINEPDLLAHHHTQAGHLVDAIPLWRKAGESASARFALQEEIGYLKQGLATVDRLPPSAERNELELSLRVPLHCALLQWHGWAAPEVGKNAEAIDRLPKSREQPKSLLILLWGKWINTLTRGRVAEALQYASDLLHEGSTRGEIDMQILGHRGSMFSHFYLGELRKARDQGDKALRLYDPSRAGDWIALVGNDVRTAVGVCQSQAVWMLGYPDQAAQESDDKDANARRLGHPFDIGWALTWGAYVFDYRREPNKLLARAKESEELARRRSIPVLYEALVPVGLGLANLRLNQLTDAITELRRGINGWIERGGRLNVPYMKSALGEALARQGDIGAGLNCINEALTQIDEKGWNERVWLPEVLRLKGWMLVQQTEFADAEAVLRESIDWARSQQAKSWELRSSTTLARLLIDTRRRDDARVLLDPIYNWFKQGQPGLETHDLTAAREVLDELG